MHFDNNRKNMEVHKYILIQHKFENKKILIFHLLATYFISYDICIYFNEFYLYLLER